MAFVKIKNLKSSGELILNTDCISKIHVYNGKEGFVFLTTDAPGSHPSIKCDVTEIQKIYAAVGQTWEE